MDAQSSTAAMPEDRVLVIERTFDAPRPLVFKAWTEAERMARWFGPHGFTNTVISHDFRVGGGYRLYMRSPQGTEHFLKGVYREIVEPERLVSTFVWTDADGNATRPETVLTVTLAEHGAKTRLKLHQAVFESVTARDSHRGGWTDSMERLANFLAAAA
jgi:uncharacterized protein YndB with AHSA1/START domain